MWRTILGVVAGVMAGGMAVGLVEALGMTVFPPPADLDTLDPAALSAFMDRIPVGAKVSVVVAWAAGALSAGAVATYITESTTLRFGIGMGVVFTVLDLVNLVSIPSPAFMWAGGLLLPLPMALAGAWLVRSPTQDDAPTS